MIVMKVRVYMKVGYLFNSIGGGRKVKRNFYGNMIR